MDRPQTVRIAVKVTGTVQGVGFRPFVYSLARKFGLSGFVRNDGGDVYIEAQGPEDATREFTEAVRSEAPPLSRILSLEVVPLAPLEGAQAERGFTVIESRRVAGGEPGISPDVSLCENCRRELADPSDRRYLYPFINCTDCGPRFTIVEDIPYDRERTSMRVFTMCRRCAAEYRDPGNRRFHAEPDACWDCGPKVLVDGQGGDREAWIRECQDALLRGEILAVKGVGGFHLACDAQSDAAVRELRKRKHRPGRPFAIMIRDIETVRQWFEVSPQEQELLMSQSSPIVILEAGPECPVSSLVAPGLFHLGVMLPYSPMHTLLFHALPGRPVPPPALVMTSGNATGLPLVYEEGAAKRELGPIADRFVVHDRPIVRPCDDSVLRVEMGAPLFYRRSRGYVPADFPVSSGASGSENADLEVFGAGGEGKNTFCLLRRGRARLSQHVGDLYNEEGLARYRAMVRDFTGLYRFSPRVLGVDMHPQYEVTRIAREVFPDVPVVPVQHHHAHMVSVMGEAGVTRPCAGIILDGTGYGTDGQVWGGEILFGDYRGFSRAAYLREVAMPGGERAVMESWRMAVAYLSAIYGPEGLEIGERLLAPVAGKVRVLYSAARWDGYPRTSSAGRLFDAVAALSGISTVSTYDGESASLLGEEALRQRGVSGEPWHGGPADSPEIDTFPLVKRVVEAAQRGEPRGEIAYRFHDSLAFLLAQRARDVAASNGTDTVVLSGGVFQNPLFLNLTVNYVRGMGLRPLWQTVFPPNDGGISLGQALVARALYRER